MPDRPAQEIEVTPQMIENGVDEFFNSCSDCVELTGPLTVRDLVGRIVGASLARRRRSSALNIDLPPKSYGRAEPKSSTMHTEVSSPTAIVDTINGRVQVSATAGESQIGLLVERDGLFGGTLLTFAQADQLARLLFNALERGQ